MDEFPSSLSKGLERLGEFLQSISFILIKKRSLPILPAQLYNTSLKFVVLRNFMPVFMHKELKSSFFASNELCSFCLISVYVCIYVFLSFSRAYLCEIFGGFLSYYDVDGKEAN